MTPKGEICPERLRELRAADRRMRAADRRAAEAAAALRAAIAAAMAEGGSVRVVGKAIDRSPTTIQKWLREEKA